ncbi:MAG: hypothetical protein ACLTZI_14830 [[Eubacterium] siraeum]
MPMLIACVMSLSALEEKVSFKPGIITCTAVVAAMMIYQAVVDHGRAYCKDVAQDEFQRISDYASFCSYRAVACASDRYCEIKA